MASASASLTLRGKVRGTKISRDGTAVVVKKHIDGAKLEERFPKRRMTGKRKANDQVIPVEDVIRGMEAYAETIEPEVQRRVEGVHRLANELLDKELGRQRQKSKATLDLANRLVREEKKRTRHQAGKTVAAKQATRAARRVAGENKRQANEAMALADRAIAQSTRTQSLAEEIARRYNEDL